MVDIAQLVRAPDCGSGGRRFESDYPPHFNTAAALIQCVGYAAGLKNRRNRFQFARSVYFGLKWEKLFNARAMLGCRQVGKAPDSGSGISQVRVLPSQPNCLLYFRDVGM